MAEYLVHPNGLLDDDVIIKLGEYSIDDIYSYMEALSKFEIGQEILVVVLRDGEQIEFKVQL